MRHAYDSEVEGERLKRDISLDTFMQTIRPCRGNGRIFFTIWNCEPELFKIDFYQIAHPIPATGAYLLLLLLLSHVEMMGNNISWVKALYEVKYDPHHCFSYVLFLW